MSGLLGMIGLTTNNEVLNNAVILRVQLQARNRNVAAKRQMTGMLGVYLVAAELSRLGFIVSPTSRSAAGADLLVTDQECQRAWSVQVKTNRKSANFWLLGANAVRLKSDSHIYVFVNIGNQARPDFIVVPSAHVAAKLKIERYSTGSAWYVFWKNDRPSDGEGWELFGNPNVGVVTADAAEVP